MLNGDVGYGNSSRIEPKHAHYWFMDAPEQEFFSNKKQALETVNNRPMSGFSNANISLWENASSFETGSGLFCDRLFGSESIRTFGLAGQNISSVGARNSNTEIRAFEDQPNDSYFNLSSFISMGPTFNKGESEFVLMGHNVNKGDDNIVSINPAYNKGHDNFFPVGSSYNNHNEKFISVGLGIEKGDDNNVIPAGLTHERVASSVVPIGTTCESGESKGANTSVGSFQNETQGNNQSGMIISSYDLLMNQPPEVSSWKISSEGKANSNVSVAPVATSKTDKVRKNKEPKQPKKTSPNSFPSNVKSLLSTGILDGVPVKYVSWGRDVSCKFPYSFLLSKFMLHLLFSEYFDFPMLIILRLYQHPLPPAARAGLEGGLGERLHRFLCYNKSFYNLCKEPGILNMTLEQKPKN